MINYKSLDQSEKNIAKENEIMAKIENCIDDGKSWAFDAGAGAGKTFSLVQSIKEVIKKRGNELSRHDQKILCITYTNAAANEIKLRLKNAPLVLVSTIHDRLWDIISPYKKLLLKQHQIKLRQEIKQSKISLKEKSWAKNYGNLSEEEKLNFQNIIYQDDTRKRFYRVYDKNAAEIKAAFSDIKQAFPSLISNAESFKHLVQELYMLDNLSRALEKTKRKNCPNVEYDPRLNSDRLKKMKISHDSLLEYAYRIVSRNDLLKQIVCDKYPVVLIDEFQDTDPKVVKTVASVERYARQINHPFVVGYYGDIRQNIYDDGVGKRLFSLHRGLERIRKTFNRRCSPEVINVANLVRNDGLKQKSFYSSFPKSDVRFYTCDENDRLKVVDELKRQWGINIGNSLHCFELTNELVANKSGFGSIYNFFKVSRYYRRGRNYELLRDHVLSQDENKLGDVQKVLYWLLEFNSKTNQTETALSDLLRVNNLNPQLKKQLNITNVRALVDKIRGLSGRSLKEYLSNLFDLYLKGDELYDTCINYVFAEDIKSLADIKNFVHKQLFLGEDDTSLTAEDIEQDEQKIEEFFSIDMDVFMRWYNYLVGKFAEEEVVYHTFHGTKGLEFENVAIFITAKFGHKTKYFSDLMNALENSLSASKDTGDIGPARNLLYVAVSRAVRNLCIVYLVDSSEQINITQRKMQTIFGSVATKLTLT